VGLYRDLKKLGVTAQQIYDAIKRNTKTVPAIPQSGPIYNTQYPVGFISTWVRVVGEATGGGVYEGRYLIRGPQRTVLDATANISDEVVGTFGSATAESQGLNADCYVFNLAEATTHYLTDGSPASDVFPAMYIGREKNDGLPCFAVYAFDWSACA
jgi:hypothetical protein